MTAQFQFFQSLPHKKADFVKKKPAEHGVATFPFITQRQHRHQHHHNSPTTELPHVLPAFFNKIGFFVG